MQTTAMTSNNDWWFKQMHFLDHIICHFPVSTSLDFDCDVKKWRLVHRINFPVDANTKSSYDVRQETLSQELMTLLSTPVRNTKEEKTYGTIILLTGSYKSQAWEVH